MAVARLLVQGVDVWVNTPQPPLEASGTSGMKAALNGIPSLSVPDGLWLEGYDGTNAQKPCTDAWRQRSSRCSMIATVTASRPGGWR
jgi:hypothetical protein